MSIAFLILAHANHIQVKNLIRVLGEGFGYECIYLHTDRNSGDDFYNHFADEKALGINLYSEVHVNWAGWSFVEAIELLLKKSIGKHDYFINLSGQCLPTRSVHEIKEKLLKGSVSYFNYSALPRECWFRGGLSRYQQYHTEDSLILKKVFRRLNRLRIRFSLPRPAFYPVMFGGSDWFILCEPHAQFLLKEMKNLKLRWFFRWCFCPSEMIFHSILLNSDFKDSIKQGNLRYINWVGAGAHPNLISESDMDAINQGDYLFARKFSTSNNSHVYEYFLSRLLLPTHPHIDQQG